MKRKGTMKVKRFLVSVSVLGALLMLVPPMAYSEQSPPQQDQAAWTCPGMQMGGGWHGHKGYGRGAGCGNAMRCRRG